MQQQCIYGLDTLALGEQITARQVSDDGGFCLHLDVVCQPTTQLDEDIEGGEVVFTVSVRPLPSGEWRQLWTK